MSSPARLKRAGRAGTVVAGGLAFAAVPAPAHARRITVAQQLNRMSRRHLGRGRALGPVVLALALTPALAGSAHAAAPVPLGTADSFAVLAGSTITNTGPTTISGDIGLCCTGLATPGFGSVTQPGGAQYVGPGTPAETAQNDLDIAYDDAAGRSATIVPVDLSLSGTPATPLLPGVYRSTSRGSLQINTGLTLDFQGDPNAVFIFQGTDLTTAAGAPGSVNIVNGGAAASSCNIYWQLSSDATGVTLGANSAFKGTTMALGANVLGTGATVQGRILTRRSKAVNLDTNTITRTACASAPTPTPTPTPTPGGGGTPSGGTTPTAGSGTPIAQPVGQAPPASRSTVPTRKGTATLRRVPRQACTDGFRASVRGTMIKRVVFSLDGKRVSSTSRSPFTVFVRALAGKHKVKARITFKDATAAKTKTLDYRACAEIALQPRGGPSRFAG